MNTVALLAYNRPRYLENTLKHLSAAIDAAPDWEVLVRLEHGYDPEVKELIGSFAHEFTATVNTRPFGLRRNAYCLLAEAFSRWPSGVLYLEDDVLLSPDALALCSDYLTRTALHTPKAVGLALNSMDSDPSKPSEVYLDGQAQGLLGCGFCCTPEQWHRFYARYWWETTWRPDEWDWTLGQLIGDMELEMWRPRLNRARNIGAEGTNSSGAVPKGYDEHAATGHHGPFAWGR